MDDQQFYSYVSTRAGADPVKTVFLFVPNDQAGTLASVEAFARESGWLDQVERDADVLVAPLAPRGWEAERSDLPLALYRACRNDFKAPSGVSIPGRDGVVWTWEVMIQLVGYAQGATFAGNFQLAHPGFAAASVLVDGVPNDFSVADAPADRWLVPNATGYDLANRDVPVAMWLMGGAATEGTEAYLRDVSQLDGCRVTDDLGVTTTIRYNRRNPAQQLRLTPGVTGTDPRVAQLAMGELFETVVRWKNSPSGTLTPHISKRDFATDGTYRHHELSMGENSYHYAVYLPKGMDEKDVRGLPLVVSVHGRGEPTWIFCQKNGWEDLADQTREFVVMLPDSPFNLWVYDRDVQALLAVVRATVGEYGLDAGRVYLTGFSNGALFTNQIATSHPAAFAGASPWNSPGLRAARASGLGSFEYDPRFMSAGVELPFWICAGDSDNKAPVPVETDLISLIVANGCVGCAPRPLGTEHYAPERGFEQGERFRTRVFRNGQGRPRICLTIMRNMPHGAIPDQARAAWNFLGRFRRGADGALVEAPAAGEDARGC